MRISDMNRKETTCRYTGLDKEYSIEELAAFHGHLGPYIVLGYRIGRYVKENFCPDPFLMRASVFCAGMPPESCLADGVQIGSGCTLGKRNIQIVECNEILCEFLAGEKRMVIRPKRIDFPPEGEADHDQLIEKLAEGMYRLPDRDLFSVQSR